MLRKTYEEEVAEGYKFIEYAKSVNCDFDVINKSIAECSVLQWWHLMNFPLSRFIEWNDEKQSFEIPKQYYTHVKNIVYDEQEYAALVAAYEVRVDDIWVPRHPGEEYTTDDGNGNAVIATAPLYKPGTKYIRAELFPHCDHPDAKYIGPQTGGGHLYEVTAGPKGY